MASPQVFEVFFLSFYNLQSNDRCDMNKSPREYESALRGEVSWESYLHATLSFTLTPCKSTEGGLAFQGDSHCFHTGLCGIGI